MLDRRLDYILIWGHGLPHEEEILEEVRQNFIIRKFIRHRPKSMRAFVDKVYDFDYAPRYHLKGKTRYLESTPHEILMIIVENESPQEIWQGEGNFRHIESAKIRALKESVRTKFNPKNADGSKSENHVIHASDNPAQMWELLAHIEGKSAAQKLLNKPWAGIGAPAHLVGAPRWSMRRVPLKNLSANVVEGERWNFTHKQCSLEKTPHFKALQGDKEAYQNYLQTYRGTALKDPYHLERFVKADCTNYPNPEAKEPLVLGLEKPDGRVQILDGLHRCCHLLKQGKKHLAMGVISS